MSDTILIFIFSLVLVTRGATLATRYSARLAESFSLSKYVVGFIVVAFISILPETLVSINSALQGVPEFGLSTLFGSNVADLSLIIGILIVYAGRGIRVESKILKSVHLYPFFLLIPLVFGLNGHYSRSEGFVLIVVGALFYYLIFKNGKHEKSIDMPTVPRYQTIGGLLFAMALLLVGSHYVVVTAQEIAFMLGINTLLIGLLVVSLGTTMPELLYSLKSVGKKDDALAIGDILGTVLADATIVVGILAILSPFYFPVKIVFVTGAFMILAALVLLHYMKTGSSISKREGYSLILFWILYAVFELFLNAF